MGALDDGLDRHFELYAPTLALARELIASKRHSQELVPDDVLSQHGLLDEELSSEGGSMRLKIP